MLIQCGFLILKKILIMKRLTLLFLFFGVFSYSQTIDEAMALYEKDKEDYLAETSFKNLCRKKDNAQACFMFSKIRFDAGRGSSAWNEITKAISSDSTNIQYRWLRANSSSDIFPERIEIAINDLKYIISTGKKTGKIYELLGYLSQRYAEKLFYEFKAPKNTGFEDDNTIAEQAKEQNNTKVFDLLTQAENAYRESKNIKEKDFSFEFNQIEKLKEKVTKHL